MEVLPGLRKGDSVVLCVTGRIYASLDDVQLRPPAGTCARCGGELYRYDDGEICTICKEELLDELSLIHILLPG